MMLLLIVVCYIVVCTPTQSLIYEKSAFCQSYPPSDSFNSVHHPMTVPEMHIPWVWEAVHDTSRHHVDVSIITPNACSFNQSAWKVFHARFPKHEKFMAGGLTSNILAHADCENKRVHLHSLLGVLNRRMMCVYYMKGKLVTRNLSLPIRLKLPTFGPMVIRCPVSDNVRFDTMQLEVKEGTSPFCKDKFGVSNAGYTNATKQFPVCTLEADDLKKKYDLSIVSATSRVDHKQMIEWIEYHRLLGVQHFFIYNTATTTGVQQDIQKMFTSYVSDGLVTLIPWYFMNCVRGMGSGRTAFYLEPNKYFDPKNVTTHRLRQSYDRFIFRPPHPIANYAALLSGYSRFRHTSTYMLYVDDDEFVSLSRDSGLTSLVQLADDVFRLKPNSSAILLHPVDMSDCPDSDAQAGVIKDRTLPRLNSLVYGYVGDHSAYEHKPLMRTDRVVLFSVHYISLLESSFINDASIQPLEHSMPVNEVALLHYKTPPHISGDPFSYRRSLPIPDNMTQSYLCRDSHRLLEPYRPGMFGNANITGHVLSSALMSTLSKNVANRLKLAV